MVSALVRAPTRFPTRPSSMLDRTDIITALRGFHAEHGRVPAVADFEVRDADGRYPSYREVTAAFGSWNAAVVAAGFAPRDAIRLAVDPLSDRTLAETRRLYEDEQLDVPAIAQRMSVTAKTVYARLKKAGVELRPGRPGRKVSDAALREVSELYVQQHLTPQQVADRLGVSYSTVLRRLEKAGVTLRSASGSPADSALLAETVRLYRSGLSTTEVAARMEVVPSTVRYRLIRAGEPLREPGGRSSVNAAQVAEMVRLYDEQSLSLQDVADAVGVEATTVRRQLKRAGVPLRGPGRPRLGDAVLDQAAALWDEHKDLQIVADAIGVSIATAARRLERAGVRQRPRRARRSA
jgi:DNA-directed RNA polymerase specialized sigma24 family protein